MLHTCYYEEQAIEQSTTLFTSIYKTSKGDIHIPSQDHFIHLLGVYDVHIVLVEV